VERPTPLYDAQATVESFLATHPGALRRARSAIGLIAVGALAAILIVLSVDAVLRGPWLDEFWTLELSDTRKGIGVLIRDGWLHDSHPPVFNLWATFLTFIGVTSIPVARLASNLPAAGLMVFAALNFSRRMPEQAGFYAAMLLLTLSLPLSVETFGNYRLSLLKNPSGHGIGLPMKAMVDDFGYSNRALLSRDPVSLHGF
jgi:hypothetical protein